MHADTLGEVDGVEPILSGLAFDGPDFARTPLVVDVSGAPGAGSSTMAAALAARFGVVARPVGQDRGDGPDHDRRLDDPADLLIRVIGAQARACDRAAIRAAEVPVVVVAAKADTRPDADRLAANASEDLACPVHPVSALPAAARITSADVDVLRSWAAAGVRVPESAAAFAAAAPDQGSAARLLALLGRAGLVESLAAVSTDPDLDAQALAVRLRQASGLDALVAPIAAASAEIARGRRVRRLSGLRLHAARGFDRVAVERRLAGERVR
ncbi:hypothetical protein Y710_09395 [Gordonia sp. QH-12]|nr:hypothetical protein Y710_09395 [Gordonia sp. QH-12]